MSRRRPGACGPEASPVPHEPTGVAPDPAVHVVLVAPEIPQNTGSIARLCAATQARLHLIRPLGFQLDDRHLKRAGLDYWPHVDVCVHDGWTEFVRDAAPQRLCLFSARADRPYTAVRYRRGDALVFGCETRGLPPALLAQYRECTAVIPIFSPHVRSLNLANAVSIVVYEALRQMRGWS